jgi:hypothetical protein
MTSLRNGRSFLAMAFMSAVIIAQMFAPAWAGVLQRSISTGAAAHTIETRGDVPAAVGHDHPYSEAEKQGAGCLALGGGSTLIAYMINTDEYLMIAAGGTLASSSPPVIALALFSTVAASGCAVGAIAAPVIVRWYREARRYWEAHWAAGDGIPVVQ